MNNLYSLKNSYRFRPSSNLSVFPKKYSSITKNLKEFPIRHNKACFYGYIALTAAVFAYLIYDCLESLKQPSSYGSEKLIERLKPIDSPDSKLTYIGGGCSKRVYKLSTKAEVSKEVAMTRLSLREESTRNEVAVASEISIQKTPGLIPMGIVHNGRYEVIVATKFCNRGTLTENVNNLTLLEQIQVLNEVWKGLLTLHSHNFMHNDIKMDNVLIHQNTKGQLKSYLSDFGNSRKFRKDKQIDIDDDLYYYAILMTEVMGISRDIFKVTEYYSCSWKGFDLKTPETVKAALESTSIDKKGRLNDIRAKNLLQKMLLNPSQVKPALISATLDEIYEDLYNQSLIKDSALNSKTHQRD